MHRPYQTIRIYTRNNRLHTFAWGERLPSWFGGITEVERLTLVGMNKVISKSLNNVPMNVKRSSQTYYGDMAMFVLNNLILEEYPYDRPKSTKE